MTSTQRDAFPTKRQGQMNNEPNPKIDPEGSVRAAPSGEPPARLSDLRGIAAGALQGISSEEFVERARSGWGAPSGEPDNINSGIKSSYLKSSNTSFDSGEPVPLPEPDGYGGGGPAIFTEAKLIAYGDARARAALLSARPPELDMTVASIFKRGVQSGIEQERTRALSATPAAPADAMPDGPVREALAELVALKDLKATFPTDGWSERWHDWALRDADSDYKRRKPLAWEAARAALRASPATASPVAASPALPKGAT